MSSGSIISRVRTEFRETRALLERLDRATRKALVNQGMFIRGVAKQSMSTSSPHPSPPGKPPRVVTGLLRNFLFWAYDPTAASVVVGPAAFRANATVPCILEEGGDEMAHVKVGTKWQNKVVHIAARPYMAPALVISQQRLPEYWANNLSK